MGERLVVDAETGEVLTTINDGDRIVRKESIEFMEQNERWNRKGFTKCYTDELRMVIPSLSTNERAVVLSLIPYINVHSYEANYNYSNIILFSNKKQMGLEGVIGVCGLSRNTTVDTINSLVKKDILYKGRNSKGNQYFMNPWLIHRGGSINKTLKAMFGNYRVRTEGNVQWKDL